jgi:enolase
VPSGASTGEHEAVELRDGDKKRYRRQGRAEGGRQREGKDRPALIGFDACDQVGDRRGDDRARRHAEQGEARRQRDPRRLAARRQGRGRGRSNLPLYRYIGGPTRKVLPAPMMNIMNGGAHSDAPIDFQEFMIMPVGAPTVRRGGCAWAARCSTR